MNVLGISGLGRLAPAALVCVAIVAGSSAWAASGLGPTGETGSQPAAAAEIGPGNAVAVTTNIRQEWRTPPLWGVRDSGPWLHDGRAVTIEEAILLHGGEGERSARRFRNLRPDDRDKILLFLNSLAAPGGHPHGVPASAAFAVE